MADSLATLRKTIEEDLKETFGSYQVDKDGDFVLTHESVITWIRPAEWIQGQTVVNVFSITNVGMDVTPELTKFLATENSKFVFGAFALDETRPSVLFRQTLLGDFLQRKELEAAIAAVVLTANQYDDQIKQRFGGRLFTEG